LSISKEILREVFSIKHDFTLPDLFAEDQGLEYSTLIEGDILSRVVWFPEGEVPDSIETNRLGVLGFDVVDKGLSLRGVHVTDDVEFWVARLFLDYGNDVSDARVIEIVPDIGDILVDDIQYSVPSEDGSKADSRILITNRKTLVKGKDFNVTDQTFILEKDEDTGIFYLYVDSPTYGRRLSSEISEDGEIYT